MMACLTDRAPSLEYASPESLPSPETGLLQQVDSKADMWSLGMILHKLLFFRLPYRYAAYGDALEDGNSGACVEDSEKMARLEKEVLDYTGYVLTLNENAVLMCLGKLQIHSKSSLGICETPSSAHIFGATGKPVKCCAIKPAFVRACFDCNS
jgi:serine/threonine protein kinase